METHRVVTMEYMCQLLVANRYNATPFTHVRKTRNKLVGVWRRKRKRGGRVRRRERKGRGKREREREREREKGRERERRGKREKNLCTSTALKQRVVENIFR